MLKKHYTFWLLMLVFISIYPIQASAGPGSCERFEFPLNPDGELDWPHTVKALRTGGAVYPEANLETPLQDISLNFNQNFKVLQAHGKRLLVRPIDSNEALGWVKRTELLCNVSPLRSASGLQQKFYALNIPETSGAPPRQLNLRNTPDTGGDNLKGEKLKAFVGYFIFDRDEHTNSYLVAENSHLDAVSKLLGWIDAKNGILWDSAYGLRPASEHTICAYLSIDDALNHANCLPIQGGERWYRFQERFPLLEKLEYEGKPFYRVLLSFYQIVLPFERIYQYVSTAYIPASDEIAEDVWLTSSDLEKWKDLLRSFSSLEIPKGPELREGLVNGLTQSIERIFRKTVYGNTHIPLSDFLREACGLAVRLDSPLFRYSIDELADPVNVADCEIQRLILWGKARREMLSIVLRGTEQPVYTTEDYSGDCPSAEHIPLVLREIEARPLGDADMRYDHHQQKIHAYWVPKEFLP